MDEQENEPIDPIKENRVKLLKLSRHLLAEMFIQGKQIAYEVIENGLPADAVCIDGGVMDAELRLVIASASFEPYTMEPVEGKIPLMPELPAVVVKSITLPPKDSDNGQEQTTKAQ